MQTSLQQIQVSSGSYFLRLDWTGPDLGSGFRLLLTDTQEAWRGEVSEAALCEEATELEMDKNRYMEDLQQALTGAQVSSTYTFSLSPERGSTVTLAYEKVQKDISFQLGSVLLTALPDPAEAVRDLLMYSLDRAGSLENHNHRLQEQNQSLREEHQRITAEMKTYRGGKEALEAELFSRFVLVLNEKKAKIRSLQRTLTDLQDSRTSSNGKETATHQEQDGEDEYGGSTDEEAEKAPPTTAEKTSTLERSTPSPLDDSLNDLTDVAPCRKRRFRHLQPVEGAAKQTKPGSSKKKRSESPGVQTPQGSTHAAGPAVSDPEDLFEDF